jgi:hypothetical protein
VKQPDGLAGHVAFRTGLELHLLLYAGTHEVGVEWVHEFDEET